MLATIACIQIVKPNCECNNIIEPSLWSFKKSKEYNMSFYDIKNK